MNKFDNVFKDLTKLTGSGCLLFVFIFVCLLLFVSVVMFVNVFSH